MRRPAAKGEVRRIGAVLSSTRCGPPRMDARHGQWPHAGIHLVRYRVVLHHSRAVVETAGLALHDEKPKRISRLFDQTIPDFSIAIGRPRACGKGRQRRLQPSSKPSERDCPLLDDLVFERRVSETKQIQRHGGAPKPGLPVVPHLIARRGGLCKGKTPRCAKLCEMELCWGGRSRAFVSEAAAEIYPIANFSLPFGRPPSPSSACSRQGPPRARAQARFGPRSERLPRWLRVHRHRSNETQSARCPATLALHEHPA